MGRPLPATPRIISRNAANAVSYTTSYAAAGEIRLPAFDSFAIQPTTACYVQFGIEEATGQIDWESGDEIEFPAGTWTNYGTDGELAGFNVARIRAVTTTGSAEVRAAYKGR